MRTTVGEVLNTIKKMEDQSNTLIGMSNKIINDREVMTIMVERLGVSACHLDDISDTLTERRLALENQLKAIEIDIF